MKKIFLSLVAFVIAILSYAQNTLVATLTHGDNITMYYGTYAFRDAHNAAVDGDIINLSGGNFQAVNITKAITIRGTGPQESNPTIIVNSFDINIPTTTTERLNIEGCEFSGGYIYAKGTLTNAYFSKNIFSSPGISVSGDMRSALFVNNYISSFSCGNNTNSSIQFINSRLERFYNSSYSSSKASFVNCVITPSGGYEAAYISNSQLVNCILYYMSSNSYYTYRLPATSSAWNSVAIGAYAQDVFNNLSSSQNCKYATKDIFISSNPMNDLTDEAKATYLGTDGTPVGMYGGVMPFNQIPTYPRITKMNVANRTTADGKLSVEIEVSATE